MFKNQRGSDQTWASVQASRKAVTARNGRRGATRLLEPLEPRTLLSAAVLAAAGVVQPAEDAAPTITSASSDSLVAGVGGSFTILTQGAPTASLHETGALPTGVTFTDNTDGTATFTVAPTAASAVINVTLTASNGQAPDATQAFALTLVQPNDLTITNLNDSGAGSLRAAITQANLGGGLNLIKPAAGLTGTINIMSPLPDLAANIIIMGPGLAISGAHSTGSVLTVDAGETCEFRNLTITGGDAATGGGIDNEGTLALVDVSVIGNSAGEQGGGIFNDTAGVLTITDSTIDQNFVSGSGNGGGGIYSAGGVVTAIDSAISKNSAGGGISSGGGGIASEGTSGILAITNCTIAFNSADYAGGISDDGATLTLTNSTVDENKTVSDDGGVVIFINGGVAVINGTIIAKNSSPDLSSADTVITGSYDLIGDGSDADPSINANCTLLNTLRGTATHPLDPKLGPLAGNGGPTLTQAEEAGAPGIGKGADFPVLDATNYDITKTDQRHVSRPKAGIDIGAYQLPPTFAATKIVILPIAKSITAGGTIATTATGSSFTVELVNAKGQIDTTNNSTVIIAISSGPNGASLTGTLSAQALDGVASFSGISLTAAGSYTLVATDGGLTPGLSSKFAITPDLSTAHLIISQQPASTVVGAPLSPALVAHVVDQYGNLDTADHSKVTLSIISGPTTGTLGGSVTVNVSKGVASFTKATLSAAGGYTLQIADSSLADNTPVQFSETIAQATPSVAAPHVAKSYPAGKPITLTATLKSNAPTSVPFTGESAVIDQDVVTLGTAAVSANGAIKFSLTNVTAGTYTCTINYAGDDNHTSAESTTFTLNVV